MHINAIVKMHTGVPCIAVRCSKYFIFCFQMIKKLLGVKTKSCLSIKIIHNTEPKCLARDFINLLPKLKTAHVVGPYWTHPIVEVLMRSLSWMNLYR